MPKGVYKKTEEQKKKISEKLKGRRLSEETKKRISKSMKGFHPKTEFKEGHKINNGREPWNKGFNNSRNVEKYRKIMEKHLRRKLSHTEVVHHINGNILDNRIENLKVMDSTKHNRMHGIKQWEKGDDKNG